MFMESTPINRSRRDPLSERLIQQNREPDIKKPIPNVIIAKRSKYPTYGTNCSCVCGLKFYKIAILIEHIKICKIAIVARCCRICSMLCPDRLALAAHKIDAHGSEPCVDCGRRFTSFKRLVRHREARHTILECRICGKKSDTTKNHSRHVRGHSMRFKCSKCKLRLSSASGLKDHMRSVHDGQKFDCKDCGMRYTHRSNLRAHVLEKHKSLRYFCCFCPSKGYTRKKTMQRHMVRVHGGFVSWEYKESVA